MFALATAAHFGHQHDPASDHSASPHVCGFCVSLSGAADAPREHSIVLIVAPMLAVITLTTQFHIGRIVRIAARPRAPPFN